MAKMRTRKPAVGKASSKVSQYDQAVLRYIKYHSTPNGTIEFATCQPLFQSGAFRYLEVVLINDESGR
jgi:hypothetical protein